MSVLWISIYPLLMLTLFMTADTSEKPTPLPTVPCITVNKYEFAQNLNRFIHEEYGPFNSATFSKHMAALPTMQLAGSLKLLKGYKPKSHGFPLQKIKAQHWTWADGRVIWPKEFVKDLGSATKHDLSEEVEHMLMHDEMCLGWDTIRLPARGSHPNLNEYFRRLVPLHCGANHKNACDYTTYRCNRLCLTDAEAETFIF